jgi:hypothetical protein
MLFNLTS